MSKSLRGEKIRAIIIDDETAAIQTLKKKIDLYIPEIEIIDAAQNAKEGLQSIHQNQPDLVFLDIEMPWMNGFEMLECLGDNINFAVVFVTAYDQYAIKAFKTIAMDYLLKPVDKDDLIEFVRRYHQNKRITSQSKLEELRHELDQPPSHDRLMIKSLDNIDILQTEDILYCQADSNYSYIYTSDGRKVVASKTLNSLEKALNPETFVRIHRSYIVNLQHVTQISTTDGYDVTLRNGEKYPVSRRKKDDLLNLLGSFNEKYA